jgi:hypothetical protein
VKLAGLLGGLLTGPVACSHPPPDATPEGAVRAFLEDMETASDDPRVMPGVYDRLGPGARANLAERARRTSQLQGRHVEAWEMLAAGRFGLPFRPKSLHATIVGGSATVEVLGADPASEHAAVTCVYERHEGQETGGWRIEPKLPDP